MDKEQVISALAEHYKAIIELIGENPDREGLVKTRFVLPRHYIMLLKVIVKVPMR